MSDVTPHSPSITYLQVRKKVIKNGGEQTKVHCLAEELLLSKFVKDMIFFFPFSCLGSHSRNIMLQIKGL